MTRLKTLLMIIALSLASLSIAQEPSSIIISLLQETGSYGILLFLGWLSLRYLTKQNEDSKKELKEINERYRADIIKIIDSFTKSLGEINSNLEHLNSQVEMLSKEQYRSTRG
jgi:hypothetical protein